MQNVRQKLHRLDIRDFVHRPTAFSVEAKIQIVDAIEDEIAKPAPRHPAMALI